MRSIRFSSLCFGLVFLGCAPVFADEPTVAQIFKTIHTQFVHLKTLDVPSRAASVRGEVEPDLTWTVDTARERAGEDNVQLAECRLRLKDDLYRNYIDLSFDRIDFAFDGTSYQWLDHEQRILNVFEDATDMLQHSAYFQGAEFLRPYDFVEGTLLKPVSVTMLRDAATWESLEKLSELRVETVVDGQPCAVVEITNREHPRYGVYRMRVYFAKDKAYFPVRSEHYIGDDLYRVVETQDLQEPPSCRKRPDDVPAHYFAARAVERNYDWMGSGRSVGGKIYEIDVESTRVNCEISDAFFTIAPSEALIVLGDRSTD